MSDVLKIIEGGYVFTVDSRNRSGNLSLLLRNGRIAEVGSRPDMLRSMYPTAEVIDATGKVILPGFVDAHFHGESAILSAFTNGNPMQKWERDADFRHARERMQAASSADFELIYQIAYYSALKSGVTTIADAGVENADASVMAAFEAASRADVRLVMALHNADQIESVSRITYPRAHFSLSLPEEESLTSYNLQTTLRTAKEREWAVLSTAGETKRAHEVLKKNFGKSMVQLAVEYGLFDHPIHLAHTAFYDEGDLDVLARRGVPLIFSPRAILQKGGDFPPVEELLRRKIPIALATDWGIPSPLENLRSLAGAISFSGIPAPKPEEMVVCVTKTPAMALGMIEETGTLEVGKRADMVFLNFADLRVASSARWGQPSSVLSSLLANSSMVQVADVLVDGEFVVRGGHILTYSEEDLIRQGQELLARLSRKGVAETKPPVPATTEPLPRGTGEGGDGDEHFEEGFRIIRKAPVQDQAEGTVIPIEQAPKRNVVELPKDVRRTFGDEEV